MRALLITLGVILLLLQARCWSEYREVQNLKQALIEQQAENQALRQRNQALSAEVEDLRQGLEAVEERAREELGLIKPEEEFWRVVERPEEPPE